MADQVAKRPSFLVSTLLHGIGAADNCYLRSCADMATNQAGERLRTADVEVFLVKSDSGRVDNLTADIAKKAAC